MTHDGKQLKGHRIDGAEANPDTNFKILDRRSPETQARVAEMSDHIGEVNEVVLKPCPFCGGEAELCSDSKPLPTPDGAKRYFMFGLCLSCGCRGRGEWCWPGMTNAAIAAWNRRTPEPGVSVVRPMREWSPEDGAVLWWCFPVTEPPYVGSLLDHDWPGYHTHWTPIPVPESPEG